MSPVRPRASKPFEPGYINSDAERLALIRADRPVFSHDASTIDAKGMLTTRDNQAGLPARSAPTGRWPDRIDSYSAARQQP